MEKTSIVVLRGFRNTNRKATCRKLRLTKGKVPLLVRKIFIREETLQQSTVWVLVVK